MKIYKRSWVSYACCFSCVLLFCTATLQNAHAKKINNKHYKFKLTIPDQLTEINDTTNGVNGTLYFDTTSEIMLMISARESRFRSVNDYIDCSIPGLEQQLQNDYGDTALRLLSCGRALHYAEKTTVLHFEVSKLPFGYNAHLVYFLHHRNKDIQFFFTYKKRKEVQSRHYIDEIMRTLKLRGA